MTGDVKGEVSHPTRIWKGADDRMVVTILRRKMKMMKRRMGMVKREEMWRKMKRMRKRRRNVMHKVSCLAST